MARIANHIDHRTGLDDPTGVHHGEGYGLGGRIAGWRHVDHDNAYAPEAPAELDAMLAAASQELIEQDMAETILLLGAVLAGVPRRLRSSVPVPVLDGITAGVGQLELLVRMNLPKPTAGSYAHPGRRELVGLDPAIDALLEQSPKQ